MDRGGRLMASKIVRYEFIGDRLVFWVLFMLGITLPFAILYLLGCTVRVDEELKNPSEFLAKHRAKYQ